MPVRKPSAEHFCGDRLEPGIRQNRFLLAQLGAAVLSLLAYFGRIGLFLGQSVGLIFIPPLKIRRVMRQVQFIGARSLLVIALTGLFAGMVLGLQGYYTLARFGSEAYLGPAVALSLITELGPVLSALMVTGRAGAAKSGRPDWIGVDSA